MPPPHQQPPASLDMAASCGERYATAQPPPEAEPADFRRRSWPEANDYRCYGKADRQRGHGTAMLVVIAHPDPARASPGRLVVSTKRTVSSTEARLAFAVLTTERKAA